MCSYYFVEIYLIYFYLLVFTLIYLYHALNSFVGLFILLLLSSILPRVLISEHCEHLPMSLLYAVLFFVLCIRPAS